MASPPRSLARAVATPPSASVMPRTIDRPMPIPRRARSPRAAGTLELVEDVADVAGRHAGSAVLDRDPDASGLGGRDPDPDRCAGWRVVGDVLEDVRHDRVEQDLVDPDERGSARHLVRDRSVAEDRCEALDGALDERLDLEHLEVGSERARFDPAQVEDGAHEPVESLGLSVDALGGLADLGRSTSRRPDRRGCPPSRGCSRAACAGRATPNRAARS